MSKDNTNNGIIEETSPKSQNLENSATTKTTEKSLEELENEKLQAISQGDLPDTAINYANYINKPNKIIKNQPTSDIEENPLLDGNSVKKINSRPDTKELRKRKKRKRVLNETSQQEDKSTIDGKPIKIDTKSNKTKSELESLNDTSNNDDIEKLDISDKFNLAKERRNKSIQENSTEMSTSTGPIDISEKFNLAKARRTKKIDELNSNLSKTKISSKPISKSVDTDINDNTTSTTTTNIEPPKVEITQTIINKTPKEKKSLKERIENYFFIDEDDNTNNKDKKSKFNPFKKKDKSKNEVVEEPQKDVTNDISKSKNVEEIQKEVVEDISKVEEIEKEVVKDISKVEEIQKEVVQDISKIEELPKQKQKFEIVSFMKSLFLGDDYSKKEKPKKQTFKERMTDFFYPEEDRVENNSIIEETPKVEPIEESPIIEETPKVEPVEETPIVEKTPKVEPVEKTPIVEETPKFEPVEESPIIEETPKVEPVEETPIVEKTPKTEPIEETPIIEETPKVEPIEESPIIEETPKIKPIEESPIIEETPKTEPIEENPIIEETPKTEPIENTQQKKLSLYRRVKNFFLSEEIQANTEIEKEPTNNINENVQQSVSAEEPKFDIHNDTQIDEEPTIDVDNQPESVSVEEDLTIEKNPLDDDDNLIMPFNEDTPSDAIDIPLEEPPHYDHFWQDPDFSIVDRIKTYRENYKNRKRSGEYHVEIKSTPDTAIFFDDLERKLIAEQKLSKSREEYKKQVENGEYDDFVENPSKKIEDEPVFEESSLNDFNSYDDTNNIKDYIADMKNNLMVRMVITTLIAIISFYITVANDLELPLPDTLNATISASGYLLSQSVLGFLAIITSVKAVFSGIVKIFKGQSDCDSLASIGVVFAFISTLLAYFFGQTIVEDKILNVYMCVGIIGLLCNLWGKNLILKRQEHNFRYISKDKEKYGLYCMQDDYDAENITKGLVDDYPITAYNRKTKFAKDFLKYSYSRDMADKFSQFAVPVIVGVSLIVSIIAGIVYNRTFEMQIPVAITSILSMLISFCSCFTISININSMLNTVSEKYPRREGVLLGYQAVEDFYDTNSIVISANDIFPKNTIKLCAMKLFATGKLDETLLYAISLANKCNSILAPMLMKIVENKTDYLRDIENYSYQDDLGICGWIDNKRILMGNRELMEMHNVENLPSKSKELEFTGSNRDAIYISVSGNLALMLIVEVTASKEVKHYLHNLEENDIAIAVTSSDFLVSISRISYLYDINEDSIKVIPYSVYQENKEYFNEKPKCSSSIITGGNMNILTDLLILTRNIHKNALIGNILYAVACILGILIGISFITMGAFKELNPTMILFYNGVCTLITVILTRLKI